MKSINLIFCFAMLGFAACGDPEPSMNSDLQRQSDERLLRPDSMEKDNTGVADTAVQKTDPGK